MILNLYCGAGLSSKGLELGSGIPVHSVDNDENKLHLLKLQIGNNSTYELRDLDKNPYTVEEIVDKGYKAVWLSPPCQGWSDQNIVKENVDRKDYYRNKNIHLFNSLKLVIDLYQANPKIVTWVENVVFTGKKKQRILHDFLVKEGLLIDPINNIHNDFIWGTLYNAAQFLEKPLQRRRRVIGGNFDREKVSNLLYRGFKYDYKEFRDICPPALVASEYKATSIFKEGLDDSEIDNRLYYYRSRERRYFTRWYMNYKGTNPSLLDMAVAMGVSPGVLYRWVHTPIEKLTSRQNEINIIEGMGNGVPVYMAEIFGKSLAGKG